MFAILVGVIVLPGYASARAGTKFTHAPEVTIVKNSQTLDILEGSNNTDPVSFAPVALAMADNSALVAESEAAVAYVDDGKHNGEISTYIVHKDDTLPEVAKMFGVSANTILWANNLKSSTLKEGQELVILPVTGVRHVVKSGDTIQSIVKKYKGDLDDVLSYNGLDADAKLAIGDEVIVPDGEVSAISASTAATAKKSAGLPSYSGYYQRPISGGVKSQGIHGHNGVDLAAPVGTPIMAAADGTVIVSLTTGYNGGYGMYVVIKHPNGTQTLYAHMSKDLVSVGDTVKQGEQIGAIGMTGKTTGPHVHFEVRGAVNPF